MTNGVGRSLTQNTAVMVLTQIITWGSTFVLMIVLPRTLGSEEYGRIFVAVSVAMVLDVFIAFGGQYHITKEISLGRRDPGEIIGNAMALRAGLWSAGFAALFLFARLSGYGRDLLFMIMILGTAKLWEGATTVLRCYFQGIEKMEYPSAGAIAERVLLTTAGVGVLLRGGRGIAIAAVMGLASLVNFCLTAFLARKFLRGAMRVSLASVRALLREGLPYFLWTIFAVVYYRIDAVMLTAMCPPAVVGWYGVAYRFFDVLMFLPSIFAGALFPILARLRAAEGGAELERTTQRSIDLVIMAGIPVALGVFACAPGIVSLFFGLGDYGPAIILLRVLVAGLPLVYINFVLAATIVSGDRQRSWSLVAAAAIPINVALNYVLIPYWQSRAGNGGVGAALATLVTEDYVMIAGIFLASRSVFGSLRAAPILKALCAGGVMGGVILAADRLGAPRAAGTIAAALAYGSALLALRSFSPAELRTIRSTLSPRGWKGAYFHRGELRA